MKQLIVLVTALSISIISFGQRSVHTTPTAINSFNNCYLPFLHDYHFSRTTAIGDTFLLTNLQPEDTPLVIYSAGISDSGYLTGTDIWNDMGFAESYTINGSDSSLVIIGVVALFHGTITSSSPQTVTFDAWDETPYVVSATYEYGGLPNDCLDSLVVPATQLGIGVGTSVDTLKTFLFPSYTDTVGNSGNDINFVGNSFFVGYTVYYNFGLLTGDTLGLACTMNGDRSAATLFSYPTTVDTIENAEGTGDSLITVTDTIVNVQNATQQSDYSWHDNYTNNDSLLNDLAIYPIVVISGGPTSVNSVTRKGLTVFGSYPNPAADYTNIKFSLLQPVDVTIQIMDMKGGIINTVNVPAQTIGEHTVPVNTSCMAPGNYIYFIHTSSGDGLAGKLTIVK